MPHQQVAIGLHTAAGTWVGLMHKVTARCVQKVQVEGVELRCCSAQLHDANSIYEAMTVCKQYTCKVRLQ